MNHSIYENTKKETWGILLLWACFALWVMIPCYLLGYQQAPKKRSRWFGLPILVLGNRTPMAGIQPRHHFFVCFGMAEDPLDAHESSETDTTSQRGIGEIDAYGNPFTLDRANQQAGP